MVDNYDSMLNYLGYFGALFIGLILGLTGGGGSILTVPLLVYVLHFNPVTAAAYSLFIVGSTSAFGTILNLRKGIVELKTAFLFAIPSFVAVFLTRKFIVPAIPDIIYENDSLVITKNSFLMIVFAIVMLVAAVTMLKKKQEQQKTNEKYNLLFLTIKLMLIGLLIGLIGSGGGFLIIPALVFVAKLPMRKAIATSLLIISLNSLIGFMGDLGSIPIDWTFLFLFTIIAMSGIFIGLYLSKFFNESQLKKGFGWFVLCMALFILSKEIFPRL